MKTLCKLIAFLFVLLSVAARAELPWQLSDHTRYVALGDSLAAGYGAVPATQGYVYLLYQAGVFDSVPNTLLSNAAIPAMTSQDVLDHQVPEVIKALQAHDGLQPTFITLTIGGNDLLEILEGADPGVVLANFQNNLIQILAALRTALPHTGIYVSNLYTIPQIAGADTIVPIFNIIVAGVAGAFGVPVADVYNAFLEKKGLLLIEKHGADPFEVHPTNAGHRAIARAFEVVIP
jgi:lysophospholipase L1-like esterase